MALWISFAVMTAIAALAILRPFWRPARPIGEAPRDLEVYRQQLQEVEEETARGVLGQAEADVARIEISRRILAAADDMAKPARPASQSSFVPYALAAALPLITLSLYIAFGSPNYPGQPLSARAPAGGQSVDTLVARVE